MILGGGFVSQKIKRLRGGTRPKRALVIGGQGWIVNGPASDARYEPGAARFLRPGATAAKAAAAAAAAAAARPSARSSAAAPACVASLNATQRRSWFDCARMLRTWDPART